LDAAVHVDPAQQLVVLTLRDELDVKPFVVALPFALVKAIAAKILEADVAAATEPERKIQLVGSTRR
jgi:hypothetical protein